MDVIEHLSNPIEFLNVLKSYLNEDGLLLIATPDRGSFLAKLLGKKWWHYRIAHMLQNFVSEGIWKAVLTNIRTEDTKPAYQIFL